MNNDMVFYVDKRFLGTTKLVEDDSDLVTPTGKIPIFKGQIIFTNANNEQIVMSNNSFNHNYIEVEKVQPKPRKKLYPFEQEYTKQLMEFGSLENNIEDQDYIDGLSELSKNKAF